MGQGLSEWFPKSACDAGSDPVAGHDIPNQAVPKNTPMAKQV